MFWYRHQRPKNKKNTITIRACLGPKNSPELEIQIKPKKLIKDFPFFASLVRKKEKRNLLVFEGGPLRRYGELVNKCLSVYKKDIVQFFHNKWNKYDGHIEKQPFCIFHNRCHRPIGLLRPPILF